MQDEKKKKVVAVQPKLKLQGETKEILTNCEYRIFCYIIYVGARIWKMCIDSKYFVHKKCCMDQAWKVCMINDNVWFDLCNCIKYLYNDMRDAERVSSLKR